MLAIETGTTTFGNGSIIPAFWAMRIVEDLGIRGHPKEKAKTGDIHFEVYQNSQRRKTSSKGYGLSTCPSISFGENYGANTMRTFWFWFNFDL